MHDLKDSDMSAPGGLSPVSLAFVGDSVFELMVRERLARKGSLSAVKLHRMAVQRVRATAQASAYEAVRAACGPAELDVLRRGRNVSLSRLPRSCTSEQYHKATAVEALMGYLYLAGEIERLRYFFELIEEEFSHETLDLRAN